MCSCILALTLTRFLPAWTAWALLVFFCLSAMYVWKHVGDFLEQPSSWLRVKKLELELEYMYMYVYISIYTHVHYR